MGLCMECLELLFMYRGICGLVLGGWCTLWKRARRRGAVGDDGGQSVSVGSDASNCGQV